LSANEKLARHIEQPELRLEDLETSRSSAPVSRLKASVSKLSKKSEVTLAIHYALGRWTQLTNETTSGQMKPQGCKPNCRLASQG
jgi:hypothetical protein